MSVETPNVVEEAPVSKAVPATEAPLETGPKATEAPAVAEGTVAAAVVSDDAAPAPATENPTVEGNAVIAATPASEGTLGYKEHGFLKSLRYSKHFFWFGEEPSTSESLVHYLKSEKGEHAHNTAAWARETGNGVLFYTKRSEDKATPAGVIILADASTVLKEGTTEFSFTVGKTHHRFQANTSTERDSWIVALEKKIEEAKGLKEEITSRDTYKKTIEGFAVATPAAAAARSSSKGPKKSLDATAATTPAAEPVPAAETTPVVADVDETKKEAEAKKEADKVAAKKERSQSRKRASIFGMLGKKDEDKEVKKEEKADKKAEEKAEKEAKKAEKEHLKEEKKVEAELKKEEAKETHEPSKAVEAAEAAAIAVAPAAAIAAVEKKEEKEEKEEKKEEEVITPTEKKNKRASVFGSLFGKKSVTSPSTEKTEKETLGPAAAGKEEVPPVSETAPKLDEPIENKPIDAAAVTAPADNVETPAAEAVTAPTEEPAKETTAAPVTEAASAPKPEKKGSFLGFIKKSDAKKEEKKEEAKEEKAAEQAAQDPLAAAAVTDSAATETPAEVAAPAEVKDERQAREKRRSSFFGSLGGSKKKTAETSDSEAAAPEVKREKSPLPSKLTGIFRKPSKLVKPAEAEKPVETTAEAEAPKVEEATTEAIEGHTTIVEPTESKIVGDVVPDELHTTVHDAVTSNQEVKASA